MLALLGATLLATADAHAPPGPPGWADALRRSFNNDEATAAPTPAPATLSGSDSIPVLRPKRLPAAGITVLDRTPLGILGDFKPDIVLCKNGDLLIMSATCAGGLSGFDAPSYNASDPHMGYCYNNWPPSALFRSKDGGRTWSERLEVMLTANNSGAEETTLSALADGTLLALGNGGASVFRSTDSGYTWAMVLNVTQLYTSNRSNWDGNGLGYGSVEVTAETAAQAVVGTLPVGVYIFVQDRVLRSTDSGRSFASYAKATARAGTSLARGKAFFEQSDSYLRKDGTLLHGTRWNTAAWDECAGSQLWQSVPRVATPSSDDTGEEEIALEFVCRSQPAAGYCRLNTSVCEDTSQAGPPQCDNDSHPIFLRPGNMYSRFLRLHDGRVLMTWTHRTCQWIDDDGWGAGSRALLSYDDGLSWDFDHDYLVLNAEDDFYPRGLLPSPPLPLSNYCSGWVLPPHGVAAAGAAKEVESRRML